ncbi:MAG: DUF3341 domain-containing protein [Alphaproteobacteria bacterium]
MREPTPHAAAFGALAEFDAPDQLLAAAQRARAAGYRRMDAFSPFPIEGLAESLGFRDRRIGWLTLGGGVLGAAVGYGLQVATNLAYPIDIGGRPLIAPPAFLLITFELMVLFAVVFAIGGMLALNHLPRLHHPLFDIERFALVTSHRFFLVILGNDEMFRRDETPGFLRSLGPTHVCLVEHTEQPE